MRFIALAIFIWAAAASGVAAYGLASPSAKSTFKATQSTDILRGEFIAVPYISNQGVAGYFIGRFDVRFQSTDIARARSQIDLALRHAFTGMLYRQGRETYWLDGVLSPEDLVGRLLEDTKRFIASYEIDRIEIRQMDYLKAGEVRQPVIDFDATHNL